MIRLKVNKQKNKLLFSVPVVLTESEQILDGNTILQYANYS